METITPSRPFTISTHARWPDMDFNAHMRNAAYLGTAEDCRMQYFSQHGFPMGAFERLRIGPVVQRDELEYHRELRLLDEAEVTLTVAGLSEDGSRFRLRNTFTRSRDGKRAAVVTSTGGWLDLDARRLRQPPPELADLLRSLPRDEDFEDLAAVVR
jgi:acyl-CoA thioester hydrolase